MSKNEYVPYARVWYRVYARIEINVLLESRSCLNRGHVTVEITIKGEFNTRVEIMLELGLY